MYDCVGSLGVTEVFDLCTNNIICVRFLKLNAIRAVSLYTTYYNNNIVM